MIKFTRFEKFIIATIWFLCFIDKMNHLGLRAKCFLTNNKLKKMSEINMSRSC